MLVDALLSAEPVMKFTEKIFEPEQFLHLTDAIMPLIESNSDPVSNPIHLCPLLVCLTLIVYQNLAEARALFDRIHTRDLYKCVDYKVIDWPMRSLFQKHITAPRIMEACRELSIDTMPVDDGDPSSLQESDIFVSFSIMHYGMKEKNPLDFVRFYSKHDPNRRLSSYNIFSSIKCNVLIIGSHNAQRGDYSGMTPQWFAEYFLRVYTKRPQFFGLVQAGYRVVLASMPDEFDLERPETLVVPSTLDLDSMAPTPPATEAPSTPKAKAHTRDNSFSFSSASVPSKTPFLNNSFTTVPPTFTPGSPSRNSKKRRNASAKRLHDDSQTSPQHDGNPKKKQKQ